MSLSQARDLSPLVEIERLVQARAKDLALDPAAEADGHRLHALIVEQVAEWSVDHKRGVRAYDLADPAQVVERAHRNLAGYGPLQPLLG